jgi:anion-transporting  ArsA/GET3 family ATPase
VLERRLLLVTGKGGTGRSALTASLAIAGARRGKRVLALSADAGEGLARHLGTPSLDHRPRAFSGIHAAAVSPTAALDEYIALRLRSRGGAALGRAFHVVAEAVPGVRDTVTIGKVVYEGTRSRWDLVVADCPPTGQIMSYLEAPQTIAGLVPSGAVQRQAAWMESVLADASHTGVVAVATPADLPVTEVAELMSAIAGVSDVAAIAANHVVQEPASTMDQVERAPAGPEREAALLHHEIVRSQTAQLARLQPDVLLPHVFGVRTPPEMAQRLADEWEPA